MRSWPRRTTCANIRRRWHRLASPGIAASPTAYHDAQGELSPWSFERNGRALTVKPGRGPVFNDGDLLVAAAVSGLGILYILEDLVAAPVAAGRLVRMLEDWCAPFAGYHLHCPDRQGTTALELFKDALRERSAA
ncbi:LysR substrate-binding domain-containing protein [Luteimonas aestuarii]|uniref:LysR substrate-binding domain-containing protein n=1 Tax=Luteimonas aestuarii TaxID=453837 RepID=UPI001A9E076E|nr:LysR substrate-binding domain-containing protein [Luteimonas aestuarii]